MIPLAFDRLTKRYGAVTAVDQLSAGIQPGRVTVFLGANGSGKTTSMRALLGLTPPTSGTATIGGRAYRELDHPARAVGAVLDQGFHPNRSAAKGIHVLPVSVPGMWAGATVAGACYGLLGVALGALTRNTIAAVLGGLAWVQIVEVGLLQHFWPAVAKWLPTGAAVAITTPGQAQGLLSPGVATVVLTGWALALALVATRVSLRRELR